MSEPRGRAETTASQSAPRGRPSSHAVLTADGPGRGKLLALPSLVTAGRPRTRGECAAAPRPCPWVGCRHHLYLDVNPKTGSLKLNFPGLPTDELGLLAETCSLDVAERGGHTLAAVGELLDLTRECVRQIEARALRKLRRDGELADVADSEVLPALPVKRPAVLPHRRRHRLTAGEDGPAPDRRGGPLRVYVAHPFSGDIAGNTERIRRICRALVDHGHVPVAPQLYLPAFVDEATERERALWLCEELLAVCDALWLFGDEVTAGMAFEIQAARRRGIPVVTGRLALAGGGGAA